MEDEKREYIPTQIGWAIMSTLFCFLPTGVVSIVHALKVDRLQTAGNLEGARESSRKARKWAFISLWVACAWWGLFLTVAIIGSIVSDSSNGNAELTEAQATFEAQQTNTNTVSAPTARPTAPTARPTATATIHAYRITKTSDSSWGARERRTLNIQAPTAKTQEDRMAVVRRAAIEYLERYSRVDAVAVRLFTSEQMNAVARVVYAPDKCGWAGDDCSNSVWRK